MQENKSKQKLILYGCGGGFDIYASLPLYWDAKEKGIKVYLLNYTFSDDIYTYTQVDDTIVPIYPSTTTTKKNKDYFPELWLAKYINEPVYAVRLLNSEKITDALEKFIKEHDFSASDELICIDAGHDAVLFGDEKQKGSPLEDVTTINALNSLSKLNLITIKLACVSAPTEKMDFKYFLEKFEIVKDNTSKTAANIKYIEKFRELLDSTPAISRSVPNEALLAGMKILALHMNAKPPNYFVHLSDIIGIKEEFKERMSARASAEEWHISDYPPVGVQSAIYYWISLDKLIKHSPFYKIIVDNDQAKKDTLKMNQVIREAFTELNPLSSLNNS